MDGMLVLGEGPTKGDLLPIGLKSDSSENVAGELVEKFGCELDMKLDGELMGMDDWLIIW